MAALTRSVHAAKAASSPAVGSNTMNPVFIQHSVGTTQTNRAGTESTVTGVVVELLGANAVAVELEHTGAGVFREEILLHGGPGWVGELTVGQRIHASGQWAIANPCAWDATERARYLAIRGRLEFRVASVTPDVPTALSAA